MEEIQHIATICRIGATDEELELMREQLSHILDLFQVLEELDTEAVPATGHSASLETVLRADERGDSSSQEEVLSNAPQREGDLFRVKVVLQE
jgi:aspartyl-tRNA(Asn)/glutamyl-tRNA(Gln) amidotransferase subunit C